MGICAAGCVVAQRVTLHHVLSAPLPAHCRRKGALQTRAKALDLARVSGILRGDAFQDRAQEAAVAFNHGTVVRDHSVFH
jgi:hypothetical protein